MLNEKFCNQFGHFPLGTIRTAYDGTAHQQTREYVLKVKGTPEERHDVSIVTIPHPLYPSHLSLTQWQQKKKEENDITIEHHHLNLFATADTTEMRRIMQDAFTDQEAEIVSAKLQEVQYDDPVNAIISSDEISFFLSKNTPLIVLDKNNIFHVNPSYVNNLRFLNTEKQVWGISPHLYCSHLDKNKPGPYFFEAAYSAFQLRNEAYFRVYGGIKLASLDFPTIFSHFTVNILDENYYHPDFPAQANRIVEPYLRLRREK